MKLIFIISTAFWVISFPSMRFLAKELNKSTILKVIDYALWFFTGGAISLSVISFIKLPTMKDRIICTLIAFGIVIAIVALVFSVLLLLVAKKRRLKDGD